MASSPLFIPESTPAKRRHRLAPLAALLLILTAPALAEKVPQNPELKPNQPALKAPITPASATAEKALPANRPNGRSGRNGWILPLKGKITNPFGNSYQYYQIYRGGHTGVDISAPKGTPVMAVAPGKVAKVWQTPNQRYGQYVVLQHGPGLFSLYGHLGTIRVKLGQRIEQGQIIGGVGATGAAGYPHLHIEALDSLPRNDGAWGYLYICREVKRQVNFVNEPAFVISSIQRQQGADCKPRPLVQTLTYYNPEVLWSPKAPVMREVAQPENEERRWRSSQVSMLRASAVARPERNPPMLPVAQLDLQPSRAASPDKSVAPGESGAL